MCSATTIAGIALVSVNIRFSSEACVLGQGRLAGELNLSTSATTALLDRLEDAGHVYRRRDIAQPGT